MRSVEVECPKRSLLLENCRSRVFSSTASPGVVDSSINFPLLSLLFFSLSEPTISSSPSLKEAPTVIGSTRGSSTLCRNPRLLRPRFADHAGILVKAIHPRYGPKTNRNTMQESLHIKEKCKTSKTRPHSFALKKLDQNENKCLRRNKTFVTKPEVLCFALQGTCVSMRTPKRTFLLAIFV